MHAHFLLYAIVHMSAGATDAAARWPQCSLLVLHSTESSMEEICDK